MQQAGPATNEQPATQNEDELPELAPSGKTPPKPKVRSITIELPIDETSPSPFGPADLEKFKTMEVGISCLVSCQSVGQCVVFQLEMQRQDEAEKEKVDAKNAVEEYVYDMRDKLTDSLARFVKEQVFWPFFTFYLLGKPSADVGIF